jgi:hypothetical protein
MKQFQWIGNEISLVIVIGIMGFLFAAVILGAKTCSGKRVAYHEVVLKSKDENVKNFYSEKLTILRDSLTRISPDSNYARKRSEEIRLRVAKLLTDSLNFSDGATDTAAAFYTGMFLINYKTLKDSISSGYWPAGDTGKLIRLLYADTNAIFNQTPAIKEVAGRLAISNPPTLVNFIAENPMAGFWIIFSIAQATLWFLVIPLLYGQLQSVDRKVKYLPGGLFHHRNWLLSCIIPLIFIGLFSYIFYDKLINVEVIKDQYLLEGYNAKLKLYGIAGYIVTVACFGMYLHMSMSLDQLNSNAQSKKLKLATDQSLKDNYNAIKKTFDGSFTATAIILSVFVLWVGITFTTINHTEAMRFYRIYSGKDFLSYDFVYLVGGFHTVLLLLFYIPVKLKFNSLEIATEADAIPVPPVKKIINNLYNTLTSLLVTASPLLAGLIQGLLNGLLGQ